MDNPILDQNIVIPKNKNAYSDQLRTDIEASINNTKSVFKFGLNKLDMCIGGILPHNYYVWLGESGTGKSAFLYSKIIFNIVYQLFADINKDLRDQSVDFNKLAVYINQHSIEPNTSSIPGEYKKIIYFIIEKVRSKTRMRLHSLEIAKIRVIKKYFCHWLYSVPPKDRRWLIDTRYLDGGYGNPHPSVLNWLDNKYFVIMTFILDTALYISEIKTADDIKVITDNDLNWLEKKYAGEPLYLSMMDHPGLIQGKGDLRLVINDMSSWAVGLRNTSNTSIHWVYQVTPYTDAKKNIKFLHPDFENLRDSKNPFMDADVVVSFASPYKKGYESINYGNGHYFVDPTSAANNGFGMGHRLIICKLGKDREGSPSNLLAFLFIGETGEYIEIPVPDEIVDIPAFYDEIASITKTYMDPDHEIYYVNRLKEIEKLKEV